VVVLYSIFIKLSDTIIDLVFKEDLLTRKHVRNRWRNLDRSTREIELDSYKRMKRELKTKEYKRILDIVRGIENVNAAVPSQKHKSPVYSRSEKE
jgi:hypothetical protein